MKKLLAILVLLFSFLSIFNVNAYALMKDENIKNYSEKDVKSFVKSMSDDAIGIASDKSISVENRRQKLVDLFNETVDLDWVTKFIMGKNYRTANKEQRSEFLTLYREYLIKTYAPKFNGYNGKEFSILGIENHYENEYVVKSKYVSNDGTEVFVDFLVVYSPEKSKFFVNDFIAEGVSFIVSQRSEINSAIAKDGLDSFLKELKTRIKKIEDKNGAITKSIEDNSKK